MPSRTIDESRLFEKIRRLPSDKVKEVEDFVEFLHQSPRPDPATLESAYREMAADEVREREALTWSEAHLEDGLDILPEEKRGDWD